MFTFDEPDEAISEREGLALEKKKPIETKGFTHHSNVTFLIMHNATHTYFKHHASDFTPSHRTIDPMYDEKHFLFSRTLGSDYGKHLLKTHANDEASHILIYIFTPSRDFTNYKYSS